MVDLSPLVRLHTTVSNVKQLLAIKAVEEVGVMNGKYFQENWLVEWWHSSTSSNDGRVGDHPPIVILYVLDDHRVSAASSLLGF